MTEAIEKQSADGTWANAITGEVSTCKTDFRKGAYPAEWDMLEKNKSLMQWALPTYCNPDKLLTCNAENRFDPTALGKIPSRLVYGKVCGIKDWVVREPVKSVAQWRKDENNGFCIRMGHEGYFALDFDIESGLAGKPDGYKMAASLQQAVELLIGREFATRTRGNARFACILQMADRRQLSKRQFKLDESGESIVELLGYGQQLACCGRHPKGMRYEWHGDLADVPQITPEQYDQLIAYLSSFGGEITGKDLATRKRGETIEMVDPLYDWLLMSNMIKGVLADGRLALKCPWRHEHGDGDSVSSTVYFKAGTNGYNGSGFICSHTHCKGRDKKDLIAWAREHGYKELSEDAFPMETTVETIALPDETTVEVPVSPVKSTEAALMLFTNEKSGKIDPCLRALEIAMNDPTYCGYEIAFDTFRAGVATKDANDPNAAWVSYKDTIATELRTNLEARGFKTPPKQDVIDKLKQVAETHKFDSLVDYLDAHIPEHDGTPRVDTFFSTYCGADDTPWVRACARYLFTALYARAHSVDGVKADIVPVLVGPQGAHKSTLCQKLALCEDWEGEIDFEAKNEDIYRQMCQKVVIEIPELGGMNMRERNSVKAFITKTHNAWIPKFLEAEIVIARRCLFMMTTNDHDFLRDPTGNRRWAPVDVRSIDTKAAERDMLQLWAEGRDLFKANGICFGAVEALQPTELSRYMQIDPQRECIEAWLESTTLPLTTWNIAKYALGLSVQTVPRQEANAIGQIMRSLGYDYVKQRIEARHLGRIEDTKILGRVWVLPAGTGDEAPY